MYSPNIPNISDKLDVLQAQFKANFPSLENVSEGYIKFKDLTLTPTIPATSTGLYSLLHPTTAQQELYMRRITVDAPTDVPISASKMSTTAVASCDNGWAYVGNTLMKWGLYDADADSGSITINATASCGGPTFTRALTVQVSPYVNSVTPAQAQAYRVLCGAFSDHVNGSFEAAAFGTVATKTKIRFLVIGV